MCGSGTTLKMAKMNNRNYVGIDIDEQYHQLSKKRIESLIPYTSDNPNPKVKFILSKEDALKKRNKKNLDD